MDQKENRGLYEQCYTGSTVTDISAYFNEYRQLIEKSSFHKYYEAANNQFFLKTVGDDVDEENLTLLEEYCSIDNLTVPGELDKMTKSTFEWCKDPDNPSVVDDATDLLQTVAYTRKRNQLKTHQVHLKYKSEKPIVSMFHNMGEKHLKLDTILLL